MENHGLYLPEIFNYQQFNNEYNVPFERIENNQFFVPLTFFRELYEKNQQNFIRLTTEFVLRGGYFKLLKASPLFPEITIRNNKLISSTAKTPKNAYKELDYDLFNIGGLIRFFDIKNNAFFNHVPLEGFKVLRLSDRDMKILESNLNAAGFTIYESKDELFNLNTIRKDIKKEKISVQSTHVPYEKSTKIPVKINEVKKTNSETEEKIKVLYKIIEKNPYYEYIKIIHFQNTDIKKHFQKCGVKYISDFLEDEMKPVLKNLSLHQLTIILDELSNLPLNYSLIAKVLIDYVKDNRELTQIKLNQILDESSDRIILHNAKTLGIETFGDFTKNNAKKLFKSNGIGKKKISNILNKTFNYKKYIGTVSTNLHLNVKHNNKIDTKFRENNYKIDILKVLNEKILKNLFYQNIHISEIEIPIKLMNNLFDENVVYLSDFLNQEIIDFFYDELTNEEITTLFKAIDNVSMNYDLLANKLTEFVMDNPQISDYYLKDILNNSTYRIVIKNANDCGIQQLGNFTYENSVEFFQTKGIGKEKRSSFFNVLYEIPGTKISKPLDYLTDTDGKEANYLAYFMLQEFDLKSYLVNQQITLVNKVELNLLIFRLIKSQKRREKILQSIAAKEEEIRTFDKEERTQIEAYQLSIEELLRALNVEYMLNDLRENTEDLTQSVSELLQSDKELSKPIIQIILFYIEKISFFEKIEEYLVINPLNLKDREVIIFNKRMIHKNPKTLEDLAIILGVTRERVRQIESKIKTKIRKVLSTNYIGLYKKHLKKNGTAILEESTLKNLLISIQHPEFYYDSKLDLFILSEYKNPYKQIINELDELFKENDVLKVKDIDLFIKDLNSESSIDGINKEIEKIFQYYLENTNYIEKNEVVIKENINKIKMYTYIINRYYSKEVLDLSDDQSYDLFMERLSLYAPEKMVEDLLNRPKKAAIRSIEGVLDRENETVLKVDAHKYRKLDVNRIPYSLIDKIYSFVNDEILNNTFVSIIKIYRKFKSEIDGLGYTERSIYYLIKFLFEEEFNFTGKTSLRIFEKNAEVLSTAEIILTTLDKNNGRMYIDDLIEEIGVEDYSIYQQSGEDAYTVRNSIVSVADDETKLSENTLNSIRNAVDSRLLSKGYVSIQQVYEDLKFNLEVNQELREKNYTDQLDLTHLLKKLFPETVGHTRILFDKDSEMDYFDVFIKEIGEIDEFHREDFIDAGSKLGLSEQTSYNYLNDFIETGKITPINTDFFVLPATLEIADESLEAIDAFLTEAFEQSEYLSLSAIQSDFSQLSRVNGHRWTIELMSYIATKLLDYKKVHIQNFKYFVDPMIITLRDNHMTYKDIVTIEMNKFNENRTDENVLNYLIQKGLLKSNTQRLYAWFFTKGILARNDFGRIYLAEEV